MDNITCPSAEEVARVVETRLRACLARASHQISTAKSAPSLKRGLDAGHPTNVLLPTGKTPLPLYKKLIEDREFWKTRLKIFQIDEFCSVEGIFGQELKRSLLQPLGIPLDLFVGIDSQWTDGEMANYLKFIDSEGIDIAVLGMGSNGHVGFHEPGQLGKSFLGGRLELTPETIKRFKTLVPPMVMTLGVGTFLKASEIILIVTGEEKRGILKKFIELSPTPSLPATLLKGHHHLVLVTDIRL